MTAHGDVLALLQPTFVARHSEAMVEHFQKAVDHFQRGEWEAAVGKAGKCIEAVLKCLCGPGGIPVPEGRKFKADGLITSLEQIPRGTVDDTIRLAIPRACRFGYDISSNRGGRHDPGEVDPNEMDATVMIGLCSWIVAEMVRFAQKGAVDPDRAREVVRALITPRYPMLESVDGRVYFHGATGAREIALVLLLSAYPGRISRGALIKDIMRHDVTDNAARIALTRLKKTLDVDGNGNLLLLAPGREEAEKLLTPNGHK
jgi:hypothetical protein